MNRYEDGIGLRAVRGLFYTVAGFAGRGLLQLACLIVLARLLTPEDFGVVGAGLVVAKLASVFAEFGVAPAVVQRKNLTSTDVITAFAISVLLGSAFAILVFITRDSVAEFFGMPILGEVLLCYALVFFFRGFSVTSEALLQRDLNFKALAAIEFFSFAIGYGLVGIVMATYGHGLWSLVAGHVTYAGLKSVALFGAHPHKISLLPERQAAFQLLRFGVGQTLSRIANYGAHEGDKAVVGKFLGADALGEFGRAHQLISMPLTLLGGVIDKVLFPTLSRYQHDSQRLKLNYRRGLTLIAIINIPAGVTIAVVSKPLVELLLGRNWAGVAPILEILAMSAVFLGSAKISDSLAKSVGAVYRRAAIQWLYAFSICIGAYIAVPGGGVVIAKAVVLAGALHAILMMRLGLLISGLSFREIVFSFAPGVMVGGLIGLIGYSSSRFLKGMIESDIVTLIIVVGVCMFTFIALCTLQKGKLIGKDGEWIFELVTKALLKRYSR